MTAHAGNANSNSSERLSESYARWRSSRLGQITDRLEQGLIFELVGTVTGKTLLDVGCGDGELASELARRGAIVTGLDADLAMIAAARRRAGHIAESRTVSADSAPGDFWLISYRLRY